MNFYDNDLFCDNLTPLFAIDDLTAPYDLPSVDFSFCNNTVKQIECPNSPSFPCQDETLGKIGNIAIPVHFRPEEPFGFSESHSAQSLFYDSISLFSESPPDMYTSEKSSVEFTTCYRDDSNIHADKNQLVSVIPQDISMVPSIPSIPSIPSKSVSNNKSEKKCKNNETITFYCTRTTCRRINRKCGQMTYQRLKKWCRERSNIKNALQGNCYYDF